MTILQIGVAKSGNLWVWRLIEEIMSRAGLPKKRFIQKQPVYPLMKDWKSTIAEKRDVDFIDICKNASFYYYFPFFSLPIDNAEDYMNSVSHVWTHSFYQDTNNELLTKFDKIVYIVRDPRDVIVSMARYSFNPITFKYSPPHEENPADYIKNQYRVLTRRWMAHLGKYLSHKDDLNIHFIFYECLLHDFDAELDRLSGYLEIRLNDDHKQAIKQQVSFALMKKENPLHLEKGASGQWIQILTQRQKKEIYKITKPFLELFSYPAEGVMDKRNGLPMAPRAIRAKQIREIVQQSNRPTYLEMSEKFFRLREVR